MDSTVNTNRYNCYCKHCCEWVMATEHISDKLKLTKDGATRLYYVCPICGKQVTLG